MTVSSFKPFVLFLGALLAAWTLRVLLLSPALNPPEPSFWQTALNIAVKWALWVLPVWWFLTLVARVHVVPFLRLGNAARGSLVGLAAGGLYSLGLMVLAKSPLPDPAVLLALPNIFVSAALPEELLFRGFVLRGLEARFPLWTANALTALLFLLFHLPGWFYFGLPSAQSFAGVYLVGFIAGALVQRTGSLWAAVAFHLLNNLTALILG